MHNQTQQGSMASQFSYPDASTANTATASMVFSTHTSSDRGARSGGLAALVQAHKKITASTPELRPGALQVQTPTRAGVRPGVASTSTASLAGDGLATLLRAHGHSPSSMDTAFEAPTAPAAGGLVALLQAHQSASTTSPTSPPPTATPTSPAPPLADTPPIAASTGSGLAALLASHGKAHSAAETLTMADLAVRAADSESSASEEEFTKREEKTPGIFIPQGGPPPLIIPFKLSSLVPKATDMPASTQVDAEPQDEQSQAAESITPTPLQSSSSKPRPLVRVAAVRHDVESSSTTAPTRTPGLSDVVAGQTPATATSPLASAPTSSPAGDALKICYVPTAPAPQILSFSLGTVKTSLRRFPSMLRCHPFPWRFCGAFAVVVVHLPHSLPI